MVCRLLAEVDEKLQLDNIVMPEAMRIAMQEFLAEKQGILIVVGPVGSGKTTFMYSIIHALHKLGKTSKLPSILLRSHSPASIKSKSHVSSRSMTLSLPGCVSGRM